MTETPHSEPGLFFPFMAGFYDRASGFAYPLIRFSTGLILMPHGAQKLFGWCGGRGLGAFGHRSRTKRMGFSPRTTPESRSVDTCRQLFDGERYENVDGAWHVVRRRSRTRIR